MDLYLARHGATALAWARAGGRARFLCVNWEPWHALSGQGLPAEIWEDRITPELDRALGMEESLAGRSFATPDKLKRLQYGAEIVNLVADNTLPQGLATTGFDDEGVAAQRWAIVENGLFSGYGTSREVASALSTKRRAEWQSRVLAPYVQRVRARLGVRAELDGPLAERLARGLARRVVEVRWGADAALDFWLRHDPDVRVAESLFPDVPRLLRPGG